MVRLHNGASLRCLESEVRQFTGKWMELETVILSEDTQTQKDEHHMFSSSGDANFESLDMCVVCFVWDSYGAQESGDRGARAFKKEEIECSGRKR